MEVKLCLPRQNQIVRVLLTLQRMLKKNKIMRGKCIKGFKVQGDVSYAEYKLYIYIEPTQLL